MASARIRSMYCVLHHITQLQKVSFHLVSYASKEIEVLEGIKSDILIILLFENVIFNIHIHLHVRATAGVDS